MMTAKSRKYIDAIMSSAKKARNGEMFAVALKEGEWNARTQLAQRFFQSSVDESDESYVVSRFISASFRLYQENCAGDDHGNGGTASGSDEELVSDSKREFTVRYKSPDFEVRRTALEFGRSFCVGSIAGGVLRNINAVPFATSACIG